ncbi:FG-GAP repeat domain-containing protein [Fluviispira sanaruensis]|uniref:Insecticide toxin TcdB middle/N-terminal domain-containing protein n=1 Tax=Fluviispira sanaruensis TaxID=2493639 RepID=A0A4P2VJZ5_FLUSA|nr:FG-GAP-like repeat-containing protein [Fluviispira sanaruensis]BBH53573.1 hypothetical protein JCM31447_20170 [Fluviispira sanaruensis]
MKRNNLKYLFALSSLLLTTNELYAASLSAPTLSRPEAPGKFGARSLDWTANENGDVSYTIPIQTPALRQLSIDLSVFYSSKDALGEAGSFWKFNLPKLALDLKKGNTQFITSSTCATSNADNLYLNGSRMIALGNGTWASHLNSARDILRCGESGFVYYKANGEVYSFGSTVDAQVVDADGQAMEWYLSAKSTFQGQQKIYYTYTKPTASSKTFKFKEDFLFVSKPLLSTIVADDLQVQVDYEENRFKNPHFVRGLAQLIAGRVQKIRVLKKNKQLRSYLFRYEDNEFNSFPRLLSVQETGESESDLLPKTLFSYRGVNSSLADSFKSINHAKDSYLKTPISEYTKFADILGVGTSQSLIPAGTAGVWLYSHDPSQVFLPDKETNFAQTKRQFINFNKHIRDPNYKKLANMSFFDYTGNGLTDILISSGQGEITPYIMINDRKIDADGNISFERAARFDKYDFSFMSRCNPDARKWKLADFSGNGKGDFFCSGRTGIHIFLNKGLGEYKKSLDVYFIEGEKVTIPTDLDLRNADISNIAVVDWNADGLPDFLEFYGAKVTLYLNNGRLAKGERKGKFFEKIDLGVIPSLARTKLSEIVFGDFTGTGLPSLYFNRNHFLINNGLGQPLTESYIENAPKMNTQQMAVANLTGTGKQQIIASAGYGNNIIELANRSFPNLLHSVVTSDGRFLSFNYSSSVLENREAREAEGDTEVREIENKYPFMPVILPVLKQVGISDHFNPMRISRYANRIPQYDRGLNKFLGFSLVRKQEVGDATQAGTLSEQRLLSGYRISESEIYTSIEDNRLSSEKTAFFKGAPAECFDKNIAQEKTQWCADLSGLNYYKRTGAAYNDQSFATGRINTQENYKTERSQISLRALNINDFSGLGELVNGANEPAQVYREVTESFVNGDKYINYQNLYGKVTNIYDEQGRVVTSVKSNSPILSGDDQVTTYNYFCPSSHLENPKIFCDNIELMQSSSSLGSVKQLTQKVVYDNFTGLPLEEWSSNQNNELVIQSSVKYDSFGRFISLVKATGENSFFEWDTENSNLKSILDHDKIKINAEYDDLGRILKIYSNKGNISQFNYDSFSRLLSTSKNRAGNTPLKINHTEQKLWDPFLNWFNTAFGFLNLSNTLVEIERYEYSFPSIKIASGLSLEETFKILNNFDTQLPIIPTADSYNENVLGKFTGVEIIPGYVSIYRRNQADEELSLSSKIWLSGGDEALFLAAKIGENRFSITNKAKINSRGKIHTEYLNSETSLENILNNKLPDANSFQVKSIFKFYSDGNIASEEFAAGSVQKYFQGVDFEEAISPEGRRSRKIYNQLGQVAAKHIGLDNNGNITQDTLVTNINYDALGRLSQISNNDGLFAMQTFSASGQVEAQTNNALGISRYFYDNYGRLVQSALCPVGTDSESCNLLNSSVLYKSYVYNAKGKLEKEEHTRFNRENGTHAKETIQYEFGTLEANSRAQDIGMPISISIQSLSELGGSLSKRLLSYDQEGGVVSEDLELFLGLQKNNSSDLENKKSVGVYQVERIRDLSGNLVQLRSRGGFSRDKLTELKDNYFTGYAAKYEAGTSQLTKLSFLQNGKEQSVPLQSVYLDGEGYAKKINLENNLELQACWHKRKEVPLAYWVGKKDNAPNELCDVSPEISNALFHSRWDYDKDLFPISSTDLSRNIISNAALSGNSLFSYDAQGRLASTQGIGDESHSWGKITYEYSVGGKINKVTRSGQFIKDRIGKDANSLIDTYSYSTTGQIGLLQAVLSSDNKETALQKFASDSIGFRKYGVAPTLAVLNSDSLNGTVSSWKNQEEIPMHKYIWNGRGQLAGVFGAALKKDADNLETNELLNYRMSDAGGGQLAEFDGVDFLENKKDKTTEVTLTKLPRNVNITDGISFERDEIHLSIDLGSFATLRLITRYPTLNATSPETLKSAEMQTRKELVVKDHVGSVSQVIDISTQKIVERNASEPFGLARGIPLLSNSVLSEFKTNNKRADIALYQNAQSNMRDNWELKSFEILGSTNINAAQGMRGSTVFATGKFSASTGLSSMGVRTLDSARGLWLSPDLFMGRSLEQIVESPMEGNLFQYACNNPISNNDPTGMATGDHFKDIAKDIMSGRRPDRFNMPEHARQNGYNGGRDNGVKSGNDGRASHSSRSMSSGVSNYFSGASHFVKSEAIAFYNSPSNWYDNSPNVYGPVNYIKNNPVEVGLGVISVVPVYGIAARGSSLAINGISGIAKIGQSLSGNKLTKGKIVEYLNKIENKKIENIVSDLKSLGLKYFEGRGGQFMHFKGKDNKMRVRIDPPDKTSKYDHMHIYDSKGNSLNKNLKIVDEASVEAHIKIIR